MLSIRQATLALGAVLGLLVGAASTAQTNDYPQRPIKLVVPFLAGSTSDIVARIVTEKLTAALGQPMVIDNRSGAGGNLGTAVVASASADGYTLLLASSGHTISPFTVTKLSYDTLGDFKGVSMLTAMPVALIASTKRGFKNVGDLVSFGKANPGVLSFASSGTGGSLHLFAERLKFESRFEAVHVPYKGSPDALKDVAAGLVDYVIVPLGPALPFFQSGKVKALAVGGTHRFPQLPDVPTFGELGMTDYVFWIAVLAPSKTPDAVVNRLNQEFRKVLALPEVRAKLDMIQAPAKASTPAELDAFIRSDLASNEKVVKAAKIQPN